MNGWLTRARLLCIITVLSLRAASRREIPRIIRLIERCMCIISGRSPSAGQLPVPVKAFSAIRDKRQNRSSPFTHNVNKGMTEKSHPTDHTQKFTYLCIMTSTARNHYSTASTFPFWVPQSQPSSHLLSLFQPHSDTHIKSQLPPNKTGFHTHTLTNIAVEIPRRDSWAPYREFKLFAARARRIAIKKPPAIQAKWTWGCVTYSDSAQP